jgi:prevent-host-death family protein
MERSLGVTEARKEFAHIIDAVQHKGENYVIVRHGQPAAAVVPIEVYSRIRQEREDTFAIIRQIQLANAEVDPDRVMEEVLKAQQSLRQPLAE